MHPCFVPAPLADLQQSRSTLPGWAVSRGEAHSRPLPCSTFLLLSVANPVTHEVLEVVGESLRCSSLPRCQSWVLCRRKGPRWSKAAGLVQGKAAAQDDGGAGDAHARGAGSGSHAAVHGDTRPEAQPSPAAREIRVQIPTPAAVTACGAARAPSVPLPQPCVRAGATAWGGRNPLGPGGYHKVSPTERPSAAGKWNKLQRFDFCLCMSTSAFASFRLLRWKIYC